MSSQITWELTGAWNTTKPFQWVAQTSINSIPTASPSFNLADIIGEVNPSVNHVSFDIRAIGNRHIRDMITTGQDFGFSMFQHPYNLPLLKYISEPPNETTPTGTSAEYIGFVLPYKQAVGASLVEHFVKFEGCKGNSLELSVNPEGLVEANSEWLTRKIGLPDATANAGLTTPVWKEFADATAAGLSHVDNGVTPLRLNGVDYPCKAININWNNNLIPDRFNGSVYVDAFTVGNREIKGSFMIPVGKNLSLETKIRELEQTQIAASYVFKTGVMVANLTGLELISYNPVINANDNTTLGWDWQFKAETAVLGTAIA